MKKLTADNLAMLRTILTYRLMTTEQVCRNVAAARADSSDANIRSVAKTLKKLHLNGLVGRDWVDPKKHMRDTPGRPAAVWFFDKKHFENLCEHLAETGRADLCEDLTTAHVLREGSMLAANTLRHELAITDFYQALNQAAPATGISLPLWLRTSPKHPDITRTVRFTKTRTKTDPKTRQTVKTEIPATLPLNPDGFHVLQPAGKECAFFLLEMDMNTETAHEKLTNKFLAYYAYYQEKGFGPDIAAPFVQKYRLPVPRPETVPFRVLFVTPTAKRRNDLLLKSRVLPTSNLFQFATLPDLLADPFGPVWLNKEAFKDHLDEYNARTHTDNLAVLRTWAHGILDALPKRTL
jgi:hypothetical protein